MEQVPEVLVLSAIPASNSPFFLSFVVLGILDPCWEQGSPVAIPVWNQGENMGRAQTFTMNHNCYG